jgi:lysophospholipase L1-like esterase
VKCSGSTAVGSRGFLTETFAAADQLNLPVLDLHKLGTDLYNQLAFCPVAGGDVSASTGGAVGEFFCDDHTHFDTPGAKKISELIADELRAQGVPLANYIKDAQ